MPLFDMRFFCIRVQKEEYNEVRKRIEDNF